MKQPPDAFWRAALRAALALVYLAAGALHLSAPDAFLPIRPDRAIREGLTARDVVLLTGGCEILGAVALLTPRLRRLAGVMLAAYAVCVFPANLKHAFAGVHVEGLPDSWAYHAPRLAAQPLLVWAALFAAGVTDWPLRRRV